MRGVPGGRSVLFTAPDGNHFARLTARGGDFTNQGFNGKITLTKIRALQSIKWPSSLEDWCSEDLLKGEGHGY
jgi:hypothetical protein